MDLAFRHHRGAILCRGVFMTDDEVAAQADLAQREHDACLRIGDRLGSRVARAIFLEITDALKAQADWKRDHRHSASIQGPSMNTIDKTARQGDVMLVRVDKLPDGLIPTDRDAHGRIVLAHGEKSGHGHAIRDKNVTSLRMAGTEPDPTGVSGGVDYIEVGGSGATLAHEYSSGQMAEHHPIDLPAGIYKVVLQREYQPEGIRRAAD